MVSSAILKTPKTSGVFDKLGLRVCKPPLGVWGLRNYFLYHLPRHIRQSEWSTLERIRKLLMIES